MNNSRRRFVAAIGLGAGASIVSRPIVSQTALTAWSEPLMPGKVALRVLNDRPLNAETPAHLLDDATTPTANLFVRNNGNPPLITDVDSWRLAIGGESCVRPARLTIAELKSRFKIYSYDLQLECGGNGRAEFRPRASGLQWSTGAVGCPRWTGVRLKDVLDYRGIQADAQYLAYQAADRHLSGDPEKPVISRGVPMSKALEEESLIAFALNNEDIPVLHGGPLRLVCGGWPGSVSGKWLTHLLVRDRVHDGAKMQGSSYRVPCQPVAPGSDVVDQDMCIIESMPVKSLITHPASGVRLSAASRHLVRGHTWAGDLKVSSLHISTDFGATWQSAELAAPVNRLAWQHWQARVEFHQPGYYEIWARATDEHNHSQPMLVPSWNPKGYLNNAAHRIAVQVV